MTDKLSKCQKKHRLEKKKKTEKKKLLIDSLSSKTLLLQKFHKKQSEVSHFPLPEGASSSSQVKTPLQINPLSFMKKYGITDSEKQAVLMKKIVESQIQSLPELQLLIKSIK